MAGADAVDGGEPDVVRSVGPQLLQLERNSNRPSSVRVDICDVIVVCFVVLGDVTDDARAIVGRWRFDFESG